MWIRLLGESGKAKSTHPDLLGPGTRQRDGNLADRPDLKQGGMPHVTEKVKSTKSAYSAVTTVLCLERGKGAKGKLKES